MWSCEEEKRKKRERQREKAMKVRDSRLPMDRAGVEMIPA